MDEIWRAIEGFENYEVSNMGRVRVTKHVPLQRRPPGTILIQHVARNPNYVKVYLRKDLRAHQIPVHQLVARVFCDNPNHLPIPDHINRDTSDNRASNLRWVSESTNKHNVSKKANATSKYFGVRKTKYNTFRAAVGDPNTHRLCSLGTFKNEEDAARAFDAKAKELYGEFARLNFP